MSKLVNLTMFRGYVNKVLPTVYDDSLSYYEVLAKVMEKINEIINLDNAQNEIINNIPEDVSEFAEDLAQFKSTMTQQFNDFKTEINADFDAFEAEVNAKIAADSTPTQGSTKLVTSGGVYASLQDIINSLVKDARPTEDSTNYVTSGGVWKAINDAVEDLEATLDTKQNVLTWDTTPTANSTNPVQSGGIKTYVDNAKQAALDSLDNYITTNDSRVSGIEGDITDLETGKQDALTFDLTPTLGSNNPVTSNGIAQAIAGVTPSIEVDPVPTQGSTNPVSSNGVFVAVSNLETDLEEGLADKQDNLTWDTTPTKNSQNPVTSGGLFEKFAQIDPYGTVDPEPTQGSTNAVSSGGTWSALQTLNNDLTATINTKQDTLTFDSVPTEDSENPVYSGGVFDGLAGKQDALTFDAVPTEDSENPVYSGGVFTELELKADKSETSEYPIAASVSSDVISVSDSANANVQGLTIYGKSRISKNLLYVQTVTKSGITWTVDTDKYITASPSNSDPRAMNYSACQWYVSLPAGNYVFSYNASSAPTSSSAEIRLISSGGTLLAHKNIQNITNAEITLSLNDTTDIGVGIKSYDARYRIMICTTAAYEADSSFEPYGIISIGDSGSLTITTTNSDSSESSTATLTTGLPLCGIPVNSGETYTDRDGQKWLTDEMSVENVVKKCYKVTFDGSEDENVQIYGGSATGTGGSKAFYINLPYAAVPNSASVLPTIVTNYNIDTAQNGYDNTSQYDTLVYTSTDGVNLAGRIAGAATAADVKNALASNPVTLIYILLTSTTQELTTEEQQALLALRTFGNITNLSITDSPYADFTYLKNTKNGETIAQLEDKINVELDTKQNMLTFDAEPTDSSTNPVTSGGVYTALAGKQDTLTWDNTPTEDSDNAISSGAVYDALQNAGGMQRTLLYTNSTPLVLPNTVTFGSDIRSYDALQIEYTRLDETSANTITPQYIEIPVDTLDTYYTDYSGIYNVGVMLTGVDAEAVFYDIDGNFTTLTYDQQRSALPTDITLNINRIFGVNYS